jgi:hypothetical protein
MLRICGDFPRAENRIHLLEQIKVFLMRPSFLMLSDLNDDSVSLIFARACRLIAPPLTVTFADDCASACLWVRRVSGSCSSVDRWFCQQNILVRDGGRTELPWQQGLVSRAARSGSRTSLVMARPNILFNTGVAPRRLPATREISRMLQVNGLGVVGDHLQRRQPPRPSDIRRLECR